VLPVANIKGDQVNMIEKRRQMRGQGGFTLIELLVVIAILGILAGVVVFAIGSIRDNANKNACKTEKATFETAADAASIEPNDNIRSYLKTPTRKYFAANGTLGFQSIVALPSDC